nr:glycosyltransferase family 4 protein [Thioalkalivibrio sp. ALE21]
MVSTLRRSGPTRQLLNVVSQLHRWGCSVRVLTLSPEPEDSLWYDFADEGINVGSLSLGRAEGMWAGRKRIKAWVEKHGVKVLHTQGIRADSMVAGLGLPHVATLRNYPFEDYPMLYGRFRGWAMAKWHLHALRTVSRPVVVSWGLAGMLQEIGMHLDVVQNGVDVEHFLVPASKWRAKEAVGCVGERPLAVATGHLIGRKDPETAINAVASLEGLDLVLLGDGDLRSELERRWGDHKRVRFVGRVEDVRQWLHAADVFVSPSRSEGLPNAVMEAMACGVPCVLSDIPPHRELLESEPAAGELFAAGDAAMMANALRRVLKNKEAASVAARKNAVERFSAEVMAGNYRKLYVEELERAQG